MKNGTLLFLGLAAAFTVSWGGMVLGPNGQLGSLAPYFDEGETSTFPARPPGTASRGQLVYADLGCISCHTQQVRRADFGSDKDRGWGERQSVARDYIFQVRPQLGTQRLGPDLANLAARKPEAPTSDALMQLLYNGSANHPAYKFLFEDREIAGERSNKALAVATEAGHEIVPTERAQSLVSYLLSLNSPYQYPEARALEKPAAKGHGEAAHKAEEKK